MTLIPAVSFQQNALLWASEGSFKHLQRLNDFSNTVAIAEEIVFRIVTEAHLNLERSKSCSPRCETSADSQGNPESQKK